MFLDILEKSKEEKKFIGIWLYNDNEGFLSGYVHDFTEEFVILHHYTKYGKSDGFLVEPIRNIESIDFEDDYSKAMDYLVKHAHELDAIPEVEIAIENPSIWQKEILEELIGRKDRIVRIKVGHGSYYSGLVEWCDDDSLILHLIGKNGQDQGKSIFKVEDIQSIRINDIGNRKRLLLHKWRKSQT